MDTALEISGFLIDMDGLLLDTERVSKLCWEKAEQETGFYMPEGFYFSLIGLSMSRIEQRLNEVMDPDCDVPAFLEVASRIYIDAVLNNVAPVKAGARDFLRYLAENEIPRCLATSTGSRLCQHKLDGCGLRRYLPNRVCGDEVANSKPSPDIYLAAERLLPLPPALLLVLEDSENGLIAGMEAGCHTAHVPDVGPVSLDLQSRADRVYRDLPEVLQSLKGGDIRILR